MYQWMVKAEVEDGHAKNKTRYAEHVFQFIHHPSIHLSATKYQVCLELPSSSRQYAWNYLVSRCHINPIKVGKMVADFFAARRGGRGGSKCQVPLGSGDGGYIYQRKQPRGAEYFTCRSGLLHYHVHWSYSIYFKYSLFKIHANIQCAKWWWWWWGGGYEMLKSSGAHGADGAEPFCSFAYLVIRTKWGDREELLHSSSCWLLSMLK